MFDWTRERERGKQNRRQTKLEKIGRPESKRVVQRQKGAKKLKEEHALRIGR